MGDIVDGESKLSPKHKSGRSDKKKRKDSIEPISKDKIIQEKLSADLLGRSTSLDRSSSSGDKSTINPENWNHFIKKHMRGIIFSSPILSFKTYNFKSKEITLLCDFFTNCTIRIFNIM